jgi:hypothetical protein
MEDNSSKKIVLSVLGIAILIVAVVGISYAVFATTLTGTKENTLTTGTISMTYTEDTNGISITNAMPTSDTDGKALTGTNNVFDFTVSSTITGVTTINYEVVAEKVTVATPIADDQVRLYLEKDVSGTYTATPITSTPQPFTATTVASSLGSPAGVMLLYSGTFTNSTATSNTYSDKFRLRMWLASTATIDGTSKSFQVKVDVYAKTV